MTCSPIWAFTRALASLVRDHDTADVLADLLDDAQTVLNAAAVGLLIRTEGGGLDVLTATSHRAAELELYQAQQHDGPSIDAIDTVAPVHADSASAITRRWPTAGPAIVDAGYVSVHAFPLRWHDTPLGALNVLYVADQACPFRDPHGKECLPAAQAFADMAALVLVQHQKMDAAQLREVTEQALAGRTIVEQAKGVIAFQQGLPIDKAYTTLRDHAAGGGASLTAAAEGVVTRATQRPHA